MPIRILKILLDVSVGAVLYFAFIYPRRRTLSKDIFAARTLLYIYLFCIVMVTLSPVIASLPYIFDHPYVPMSFDPFSDIVFRRGNAVLQVILNIAMTVPLGFLMPLAHKTRAVKTILCVFAVSIIIETLQPLLSGARISDITDVITNTAGGIIGYLLYLLLRPVTEKIALRIKKTKTSIQDT